MKKNILTVLAALVLACDPEPKRFRRGALDPMGENVTCRPPNPESEKGELVQ